MIKKRSILLYPFSLIYGIVTGVRNFLYNTDLLQAREFGIPIICVGNIVAGGTGKTPHTEYLAALLKDKFKVAILSRGYKRKSSGFRMAVEESGVNDIGDEPLQIFRKFPDIIVAVDRNRVAGIEKILIQRPDTGVILLDDGFQHRRLKPGLSIILTDYNRLFVNDSLLPYGNLRESPYNLTRADIILVTKTPANISPMQRRIIVKEIAKAPYQNLYFTALKYEMPVPLFNNGNPEFQLIEEYKNVTSILLVTGIVNPEPLREYVSGYASEIVSLPFPDHHKFNESNIRTITEAFNNLKHKRKCILTTAKDAVRLKEINTFDESLLPAFYFLPVSIDFLNNDRNEFDNLIVEYVRKNRRNNRISPIERNN